MIVIGVDAHKRTHTLVAVDEVGRKLSERTVRATSEGNMEAVTWAARWPAVKFAIEDCRHVTRRLEADLLTAGYQVVRVTTQPMAGQRRAGRERGKSDPIDALVVARVALREPDLPVASLDGPSREVKLLADYRDDLVTQRTRVCNKLRWHLHELDPELQIPSRRLRRRCVQDQVKQRLADMSGVVAQICRSTCGASSSAWLSGAIGTARRCHRPPCSGSTPPCGRHSTRRSAKV